jgi:hypothetical protein
VVVARISPFVEHLQPRWVKIGDFNAQGRALVFTTASTAMRARCPCSPSQVMIRNYRFSSSAGGCVLYHTVWRHT